ncbi:hypothetical protein HJFPF1_00171 [Paramyrothecium foliicola]|nr:hypothetical protein HJFPF1_00171 [Paramyrothecium foliicola]
MKRLSAFVSKAGDMVQQASDELQRRQQEQQYKQGLSAQSSGYHSQQHYQSHSGQPGYYGQHQSTPPLPPRQDHQQPHGLAYTQPKPETTHQYQQQPSYYQYQQPQSLHTATSPHLSPSQHFPPPPQSPQQSYTNPIYQVHQAPPNASAPQTPQTPLISQTPPVSQAPVVPQAALVSQALPVSTVAATPLLSLGDRIQQVQQHFDQELQRETERAQQIQSEFRERMENHRREGERLQKHYESELERSTQAQERLRRELSAKLVLEREQVEAEAEAARLALAAEEERAAVEKARIAAAEAEAEARAYQEKMAEARRIAAEQEEQDKKKAEELAAKYQAELDKSLRERQAAAKEEETQRQILKQREKEEEYRLIAEHKRREAELMARYQAESDERLRKALEGVARIDLNPSAQSGLVGTTVVPESQRHESTLGEPSERSASDKPPIPPKPASWRKTPTPSSPVPVANEDKTDTTAAVYVPLSANPADSLLLSTSVPPPPPPPPSMPPAGLDSLQLQQPNPVYDTTPSSDTITLPQVALQVAVLPNLPVTHGQQEPFQHAVESGAAREYYKSSPAPVKGGQMHPCGVIPIRDHLDRAFQFDNDWFVHDSVPNFLVCSRCYVDHIYGTQFKDAFKHTRFPDAREVLRMCLFASDRVLKQLWPLSTISGRLDSMIEFMKMRAELSFCPETDFVKDHEWYATPDIPNATFCRTCFEDRLVAGPFAARFQLKKFETASCDFGEWFIKRMYNAKSELNDWAGFTAEAKARLEIPKCGKWKSVIASHGTWYCPNQPGREKTIICRSCYVDYFYGHTYESDFRHLPRDDYNLISCVFAHNYLRQAAHQASEANDGSIFWRCFEGLLSENEQACEIKGITGGNWYTTPNDPEEFGICGACLKGVVETYTKDHDFIPKPGVTPDITLVCCINPEHPRYREYILRVVESLSRYSWRILGDYAATYAKVPKCPRREPGKEARWWGLDRLCICEECYVGFAKGTALEAKFQANGELISEPRLCELYSPRMRGMYTEVCEGRRDLEEFLTLAENRARVYGETIPRCKFLMFKQEMALQNQQFLGLMGVMYTGIGGMQEISSGHDYTVGNSTLGYGYANENALQGAAYTNQAFQAGAAAANLGPIQEVGMLERRWQEVE